MKNINYSKVLIYVILITVAFIWVIPLFNAFSLSLDKHGALNYKTVLTFKIQGKYFMPLMFFNTVFVVGMALFLTLCFSLLAAYAFSKMKFKGRLLIYSLLLSFYSIPVISVMLPMSNIIRKIGLQNSYFSMIIPMVAVNLPLSLLIMKNYFDSVSNTFIEAAILDGASSMYVLIKILIPMVSPAIVNLLIVNFMLMWNDYTIPLMFNRAQKHYLLTLAPGFFNLALNKSDIGPLFASIIIIALPSVLFYIIMQNKIKTGLAAGGIKE